MKVYWMWCS